MFRGAAVALIYDHTMVLPDGTRDESAAVTLMSTDIDMIARSLEQASELWARVVEIAIGIWLLERQLAAVCVAPILVILGRSSSPDLFLSLNHHSMHIGSNVYGHIHACQAESLGWCNSTASQHNILGVEINEECQDARSI